MTNWSTTDEAKKELQKIQLRLQHRAGAIRSLLDEQYADADEIGRIQNEMISCPSIIVDNKEVVEKQPEFTPDLAFGQVTQTDWQNWMDGVSTGVENPQELSTQSGVLRARYAPTNEGSLHIQAFGELPAKMCYEMEQTVRLESGWDFVKAVKLGAGMGGGSPLLSGGDSGFGTASQITTGFTLRFNLFGNSNTAQGGDNLGLYAYHINRPNQYGEDISMNFKMPVDQDVTMRAKMCMNDPGQANGTLEGWVNGVKTLTRTGIEWMTGNPIIDRCIFSSFFGGDDSTFAPSSTVYAQFKEIKYI